MNSHLLSLAVWVPIFGALGIFAGGAVFNALGMNEKTWFAISRWLALLIAIVGCAVTIPLWTYFDNTTAAMQYLEQIGRASCRERV